MTISGALNNAMSGLLAASRATQVVSSNLSNVLTEGYAARSLELSSQSSGGLGGVRIDGISRNVDPVLVSDRQLASASYANISTTLDFMNELNRLIGTPDQAGSLTQQISTFESSLITAASRPDAPDRLETAVDSARDLANALNRASTGIQEQRTRADQSIGNQVERLNAALSDLQTLNGQITKAQARGSDDASYLDNRQKLVDEISEIVPVKSVPRSNGAIALFTSGGAILIDGNAAEVGFESVNLIGAGMSLDVGSLSGLTINGTEVRTGPDNGALSGGGLSAQFAIRDQLAPQAQEQLDAVARDLIERFETLSPTSSFGEVLPGLFTDNGFRFDETEEVGLAGRVSLNVNVDPNQGGEAWRLRDGLAVGTAGDVGDATLLHALSEVLSDIRQPESGTFGVGPYNALNLSSTMMSIFASDRTNTEQHLSFASTQLDELTQQELANGVDTDAELQRLILIEQAYAANARLIQTVDEMMQTLLRI